MNHASAVSPALLTRPDSPIGERVADSARRSFDDGTWRDFESWLAVERARVRTVAEPVPLDDLAGWRTDPDTGTISHESGRFFTVEGVGVHFPAGPVPDWEQPI